jgi:hypothetical protein
MRNTRQEKQVRRMFKNLRNMNYWQRYMVMDWLNDWYQDLKEREEE